MIGSLTRLPIKLPKGTGRIGGKLCNPIKYSISCEYPLQFCEYKRIMNAYLKGEESHAGEKESIY